MKLNDKKIKIRKFQAEYVAVYYLVKHVKKLIHFSYE